MHQLNESAYQSGIFSGLGKPPPVTAFQDGSLGILGAPPPVEAFRDGSLGATLQPAGYDVCGAHCQRMMDWLRIGGPTAKEFRYLESFLRSNNFRGSASSWNYTNLLVLAKALDNAAAGKLSNAKGLLAYSRDTQRFINARGYYYYLNEANKLAGVAAPRRLGAMGQPPPAYAYRDGSLGAAPDLKTVAAGALAVGALVALGMYAAR